MPSRPFQAGRTGSWPPALLVALLAVLCLWLALRLVATALDIGSRDGPGQTDPTVAPALADAPRDTVAQWHLFGRPFAPTDLRDSADSVPDSSSNLVLVGILADADPATGVAMIADEAGRHAAYRSGDALPDGARLRHIHADRVLIVRNGREEYLRLPRETIGSLASGESASGGSAGTGQPQAPTSSDGQPAGGRPGSANAPVAVAGLETVDWSALQQQYNVDPAQIAQRVRVQPVTEDGQVVGVRLSGAYAGMMAGAGLRPDDIITAVNGVSVTDTARAQQVIAAVARAQSARVTIRRDGREETLNVSLQ